MKVQPLIDRSFKKQFRKSYQQKVNEIFKYVEAYFLDKSLKTKYELDFASIKTYPGDLQDQLNDNGLR